MSAAIVSLKTDKHCMHCSVCLAGCRYKCVIVLCDSQWCDPDLDSSNGIQMGLRDMLRIDSMLMMVQLNVRLLLEVTASPFIHSFIQNVC